MHKAVYQQHTQQREVRDVDEELYGQVRIFLVKELCWSISATH